MPEPCPLHMFVSNFDHQLGTQRLPRQVLALAPAALAARHSMLATAVRGSMLRPGLPRVIRESVLAVGREVFDKLPALLIGKACADADMPERAGIVEQAEQQG